MSSVSLPTAPTSPKATTETSARIREYSTMAVPRSSRFWMTCHMGCAGRRTAVTSLVRKDPVPPLDTPSRDEERRSRDHGAERLGGVAAAERVLDVVVHVSDVEADLCEEHDRHDRDEEQDQGVLHHALALLIADPNVALEQLLLKLLHAVHLLLFVGAQRAVLAVTGSEADLPA